MMTKDEAIVKGMETIKDAVMKALGDAFDDGMASSGDSTPFNQADIDNAVAAATASLNTKIAELQLSEDQLKTFNLHVAAVLGELLVALQQLPAKV